MLDRLTRLSKDVQDRPHGHVARQWFRSPDVLALLPFDRPEAGRSYALVWSLPAQIVGARRAPRTTQLLGVGGLTASLLLLAATEAASLHATLASGAAPMGADEMVHSTGISGGTSTSPHRAHGPGSQ